MCLREMHTATENGRFSWSFVLEKFKNPPPPLPAPIRLGPRVKWSGTLKYFIQSLKQKLEKHE